ncbi:MAG: hypothetical protein WAX89_00755 [Alphaproteobacteria bacterium]
MNVRDLLALNGQQPDAVLTVVDATTDHHRLLVMVPFRVQDDGYAGYRMELMPMLWGGQLSVQEHVALARLPSLTYAIGVRGSHPLWDFDGTGRHPQKVVDGAKGLAETIANWLPLKHNLKVTATFVTFAGQHVNNNPVKNHWPEKTHSWVFQLTTKLVNEVA